MAFGTWMKKIKEGVQNIGNKIKETFTGRKKEEPKPEYGLGVVDPPKQTLKPIGEVRRWIDQEAKAGNMNKNRFTYK